MTRISWQIKIKTSTFQNISLNPILAVFVLGGFERFSSSYPSMCYFAKPQSPSQTTTSPLGLKLKTKDSKRTFSPRHDTEMKDFAESRPSSSVNANEPVEILPHLYLGSEIHASQKELLQRLGITAIVNVSRNIPNFFEETFHYKSIPVDDTYTADIGRWFEEAAAFIGKKIFRTSCIVQNCVFTRLFCQIRCLAIISFVLLSARRWLESKNRKLIGTFTTNLVPHWNRK